MFFHLLTRLIVQARGGAKQRDALVTSWHRYSDFRALHDSVAEELGLPAAFPVAKVCDLVSARMSRLTWITSAACPVAKAPETLLLKATSDKIHLTRYTLHVHAHVHVHAHAQRVGDVR